MDQNFQKHFIDGVAQNNWPNMVKSGKMTCFWDKDYKSVIKTLRKASMSKDILDCRRDILPHSSPKMLEKQSRHPVRS